jgi:outer membrane biosynthesis protein TonB
MDADRLAQDVAERVRAVVAEAEERAAEIVRDAERDAARLRAEAEAEARGRLEEVRQALDRLEEGLAEVTPGPVTVPEPEPAPVPEPAPDPTPEPTPDPVPEPTPQPAPEPSPPPDEADPPTPDRPTTDELIEQLRGGSADATGDSAVANGENTAGARLVAMKMALDGASREEVDRHLAEEFELADRAALLDEVFARAAR